MRLNLFVFATVAFVALIGGIATAQSIPLETLNQLKSATAFIKVDVAGSPATGSGFLIERDDGSGLVLTNAHVISGEGKPVRGISCVFHSGTSKETSLPATVVGADRSRDLVILRVSGSTLPEPIDVTTDVAIQETLPVYILGFPFGEALAASSRNLALTITKASISSVRRNDFDDVAFIKLDGGINPGNSGGPIVNQDGTLVGFAAAKVVGADIGLAIPNEQLREILGGGVGTVAIRQNVTTAHLRFQLIDPHDKIRGATLCWMLRKNVPDTAKRAASGSWELVSKEMVETALSIQGSEATGQPKWWVNNDYVFQIKLSLDDGTETITGPRVYRGLAVQAALRREIKERGIQPPPRPATRPKTVPPTARP